MVLWKLNDDEPTGADGIFASLMDAYRRQVADPRIAAIILGIHRELSAADGQIDRLRLDAHPGALGHALAAGELVNELDPRIRLVPVAFTDPGSGA